MATFITSLSESELKTCIKESLRELLVEQKPTAPKDTPQYPSRMTIDQASAYLSLSKQTLYTKCSQKNIPHLKRGKRLYFDRTDLDAWVEEGRQKTIAEQIAETDAFLKRRRAKQT